MVLTPQERLGQALEGRYRIERTLGQGGAALVFAASDLRQPRSVAIKLLRPEVATLIGPDRFLREIAISAQLNHPHILPLFDSGEANGLPWFAMPLVEGESLRDRLLRERQLPLEEALRITREVADALSYAHAQGIIHRDIKPENILLSRGHALVADFGIGRALDVAGGDRLTETGLAVGTPTYMSPEQASGTEAIDARSDLYSLSCVLYEMLAGTPPFAAPTAHGVLARHLMDAVPPIRTVRNTVPEHVETAILAAMAKAKADRFPTVEAFIEGLEGRRHSPSQAYPAVKRSGRRKAVVMSLGILALISGAGIVYSLRGHPLDPHRVLVGMLENRSGDPALSGLSAQLTSAISTGLASTGLVQAVDVRSTGADSAATRELARLRAIARRIGAGSVVWGEYSRQGNRLRFDAHLTDVATGEVLRPLRSVSAPALDPSKGPALLSQVVMAGYAAHLDPQFRNYRSVSQPQSFEAYREFRTGMDIEAEKLNATDSSWAEQIRHFQRAADLDSGLILPRAYLANIYSLQGRCEAVDSVITETRASRPALLSTDRAILTWVRSWCHGDVLGRYEAGVQLHQDAPDFWAYRIYHALGAAYYNRPREALTALEGLPLPWPISGRAWAWNLATHYHHQLGQYREALNAVDQLRREIPDDPLLDRYAMRQWAALGDLDRVNQILAERERKSSTEQPAGADMMFIGLELRAHGFRADGRDLCDRAARWFQTRPADERANRSSQFGLARSLYCAERWEDARSLYETLAVADSSNFEVQRRLGAIAWRRGDTTTVVRIEGWLVARERKEGGLYGQAVLAALRGDRERALVLFQQAWERGTPVESAHIDPDLEPLQDLPAFHALMYPDR